MDKNNQKKIDIRLLYRLIIIFVISSILTYGFINHYDILGFVGSIIGVIGAYYISSSERRQQQQSATNYAIDMLCCLLDSTIKETNDVIPRFIDISKIYWENRIYKSYLENIDDYHLKQEGKLFLNRVGRNFYKDENTLLFFRWIMFEERFGTLINRFDNSLNKYFNFEGLIYDDNWYSHLKFIDDKEKIYRKSIINWIKLIKSTKIEISDDEIKKGNYLDIPQFINLRDEIIQFLKLHDYKNHKTYKEIYKENINSKG